MSSALKQAFIYYLHIKMHWEINNDKSLKLLQLWWVIDGYHSNNIHKNMLFVVLVIVKIQWFCSYLKNACIFLGAYSNGHNRSMIIKNNFSIIKIVK